MARTAWFAVRRELPPERARKLAVLSFVLPLALWCVVSYVPFIWHPLVKVEQPGSVAYFTPGMLIEKAAFEAENAKARAAGVAEAHGSRENPIYLPAPHRVATAMYTAFRTPPRLPTEPWLHQSLWQSIQVIFWGFALSSLLGVPLAILCGTFSVFSKLSEPFIEFFRYLPAPAFGALAVAVLGIYDAPKIAIIFIGTFFQQVLVVANTTRKLEVSLIEAAQTLGASKRQLVSRVVVPGVIVDLYTDMRVLLGWAWTYLIVAELVGTTSGITYFINQQARYRNYDNVYAAIMIIGMIGLGSDLLLERLGRVLFPWKAKRGGMLLRLRGR
ncbi:MAG TPA: ABC transporter permease, partial [Polyangiales bacterium]|nr:ABC transporter permease [Polyangiales bacterium]